MTHTTTLLKSKEAKNVLSQPKNSIMSLSCGEITDPMKINTFKLEEAKKAGYQ